jgi:hypothetical protein
MPLKANRSPRGFTQSGRRASGLSFFPKSNDDGLTACNYPVEEALGADAADEARYQQLASERPEEGGDETRQ